MMIEGLFRKEADCPDHKGPVQFRGDRPGREGLQSLSNFIELTVVEMAPPR